MNQQNSLILDHMNSASAAVDKLAELHLTVLSIRLGEQSRPLIEIQESRACARLESGIHKIMMRGSRRLTERVAMVCGCQVRWQQPAA
ncbi:MAG: hypothetical protein WBN86_10200 [Porticoccaceae bacterium]